MPAALAGALALDGTTVGIANAKTAVAISTNDWNLDSAKVTNTTVTFATTLAGPWDTNPNPATGYRYVRVAATVPLSLYFLPVVVPQTTQNVASTATAGQIDITSFPQGLSPYTAVSTVNTATELRTRGRTVLRHPVADLQRNKIPLAGLPRRTHKLRRVR